MQRLRERANRMSRLISLYCDHDDPYEDDEDYGGWELRPLVDGECPDSDSGHHCSCWPMADCCYCEDDDSDTPY